MQGLREWLGQGWVGHETRGKDHTPEWGVIPTFGDGMAVGDGPRRTTIK